MATSWSEGEVLLAAGRQDFAVEIYNPNHRDLRRLTSRLSKEGRLLLVSRTKRQLIYRTDIACTPSEKI